MATGDANGPGDGGAGNGPVDEDGTVTDDVDPAELQAQLEDIKGAMGLEEQYPGRARLWLVGGFLIGLAALLVQATYFLNETLSGTTYGLIWTAFLVVAVAAGWLTASRLPRAEPPANAPSWRAVFGSLFAFLVVASSAAGRIADFAPGLEQATLFFGLAIAAVGLALLLTGAVLRAYHIRRRDRLVFYAGGLWVLAFAAVFPHFQILRYVGVGIFGVLLIGYSIASWAYLRQ